MEEKINYLLKEVADLKKEIRDQQEILSVFLESERAATDSVKELVKVLKEAVRG